MQSTLPHKNLRCFCKHHPLLAQYGRDEKGELYIHVRIYKADRLYGEIIVTGQAIVRLRCRLCLRMHRVFIKNSGEPGLVEEKSSKDSYPDLAP